MQNILDNVKEATSPEKLKEKKKSKRSSGLKSTSQEMRSRRISIGPHIDIKGDIAKLLKFIHKKQENDKKPETEIYEGSLVNPKNGEFISSKDYQIDLPSKLSKIENEISDLDDDKKKIDLMEDKQVQVIKERKKVRFLDLNEDNEENKPKEKILIKKVSKEKQNPKSIIKAGTSTKAAHFENAKTRLSKKNTKFVNIFKMKNLNKSIKSKTEIMMDSWIYGVMISILVIYALIIDDIRILLLPPTFDKVIDILTISTMIVFFTEIILSAIFLENYLCSLYFYLDLVSTITMVFDLSKYDNVFDIAQIFKASRAARLGSKASRVMKVLRMVRIARLSKIYKEKEKIQQAKFKKEATISEKKKHEAEEKLFEANKSHKRKISLKKELSEIEEEVQYKRNIDINDLISNSEKKKSVRKIPSYGERRKSFQNRRIKSQSAMDQGKQEGHILNSESFNLNKNNPNLQNSGGPPSIQKNILQSKGKNIIGGGGKRVRNSTFHNRIMMDQGQSLINARNVQNSDNLMDISNILLKGNLFKKQNRKSHLTNSMTSNGTEVSNRDQFNMVTMPEESRVGKSLINRSTRLLILIILSMMIMMPIFEDEFWYPRTNSWYFFPFKYSTMDLQQLRIIILNEDKSRTKSHTFFKYIKEKYKKNGNEVVHSYINLLNVDNQTDFNRVRPIFLIPCIVKIKENDWIMVGLDKTFSGKLSAFLRIIRTGFVTVCLILGSLLFSNDANDLILLPLENLMALVNIIASKPSAAKQIKLNNTQNSNFTNEMRTMINQILKIGKLLVLVFSNAGSTIIRNTIASPLDDVYMQIEGSKTMAIFGFCDIREFTEMTEVLQQDIMIYVNEIAFLIHSNTDKYMGSSNKNIGEAFLLVWSLPSECIGFNEESSEIFVLKNKMSCIYAELALTCFVSCIIEIFSSLPINYFSGLPRVQKVLPGYKLDMGFGLHVGWAIEGAIGSQIKIDTSYLSPNVNLASRLEAATKQFGVPILFSDQFYYLLSENTQRYTRIVDRVTVKGSEKAIDMYTINFVLNYELLAKVKASKKIAKVDKTFIDKYKSVLEKAIFMSDKEITLLELNSDLEGFIEPDSVFTEEYEEGLEYYLSGNWNKAWRIFKDLRSDNPSDGPTRTLLNFIEKNGNKCPEDWRGFRPLTQK